MITACGTTRTNFVDDYEVIATEIGRGDCFAIAGVDAWTVIDDHHVYIRASKPEPEMDVARDFLITTKSMCRGFMSLPVIEFPRSQGIVCQNESRIGYSFTEHPRTCSVDNIEVVESRSAAISLVSSRSQVDEGSLLNFILRRENAVDEGADKQ